MTFKVAGVRRLLCRNSRYCSIEECILSPLSGVNELLCFFTTPVQILRHVKTMHEQLRFCTFSVMLRHVLAGTCRRRGHLRHVGPQSREPLPPPLFYTGYTLSCAARTCAHHERKRRSLMKRQWTHEELIEHWTLSSKELDLIGD